MYLLSGFESFFFLISAVKRVYNCSLVVTNVAVDVPGQSESNKPVLLCETNFFYIYFCVYCYKRS